jgi:tetratricopeptide (TPR) repeat protein
VSRRKRFWAMVALATVTMMSFVIYWSQHLTYKAYDMDDAARRMGLLEKAAKLWFLNDIAQYELGKAYFDYGFEHLADAAVAEGLLEKSAGRFAQALRLNPANFYAHYDYGRLLFYLNFLTPDVKGNFIGEYKKAAALTGHHGGIYFEVGRVLFARWDWLSVEDREFTAEILKSIIEKGDRESFESILQTWEMNVRDYGVMRRILPENPGILRTYARFLGEKSLSIEERHKVLALAESLEFQEAREQFMRAQNLFRYFRIKEAAPLYQSCLDKLKSIEFYQELIGSSPIDIEEYAGMLKTINLQLAKCGIQGGKNLAEVEGYLRTYLNMVDRVADARDLENYLVEKGQIGGRLEDSLNDLGLLSFHSLLCFKQSQYRDIKNIGSLLQKSYVIVPEEEKENYIEVLRMVADAHQVTGYFYDALQFYKKALEVDADNEETLLELRRNYERLSEENEIRKIDQKLEHLISPGRFDFKDRVLGKGETFRQTLYLDGSGVNFRLVLGGMKEENCDLPLMTMVLNGRVVWEDYVKGGEVSIVADTKKGDNVLTIESINRPVILHLLERS